MDSSDKFEKFILLNAEDYPFNLSFDDLEFLSSQGNVYTESVSFKHAIKLYVDYADAVQIEDMIREKPKLNVTGFARDYVKNASEYIFNNRTLSVLDQQLFFLFENGMYKMGELGLRQKNQLLKASINQSDNSKKTLDITTFISIGIVSIIGIVIFPMLTRIFDRIYSIIKVFNLLNYQMIDQAIEKGLVFHQILIDKIGDITNYNTSNMANKNTKNIQRVNDIINKKNNKDPKKEKSRKDLQGLEKVMSGFKSRDSKKHSDDLKNHMKIDGIFEADDNDDQDQNFEVKDQPSPKIKIEDYNLPQTRGISKHLKKLQLTQKFKLFLLQALIILYLNSSLMISFFQSEVIFKNDKETLGQIDSFLRREECAYNLMLFMREKIIRNYSVSIKYYTSDEAYTLEPAVEFYIDQCIENENSVAELRKNTPVYLENAKAELDSYESGDICNLTFSEDKIKREACFTTMNGILNKGISTAIYSLINYIQTTNIKFETTSSRNSQFLDETLEAQKMHDLADFLLIYLKDSFDKIQYFVNEAAITYFDNAKNYYLLAFGLFMAFTTISSIIVGFILFKKVKLMMLEIQNMLVIIPFNEIPQNQRLNIESILNK